MIQEACVEEGIVRDQNGVAYEVEQRAGVNFRENRSGRAAIRLKVLVSAIRNANGNLGIYERHELSTMRPPRIRYAPVLSTFAGFAPVARRRH